MIVSKFENSFCSTECVTVSDVSVFHRLLKFNINNINEINKIGFVGSTKFKVFHLTINNLN